MLDKENTSNQNRFVSMVFASIVFGCVIYSKYLFKDFYLLCLVFVVLTSNIRIWCIRNVTYYVILSSTTYNRIFISGFSPILVGLVVLKVYRFNHCSGRDFEIILFIVIANVSRQSKELTLMFKISCILNVIQVFFIHVISLELVY